MRGPAYIYTLAPANFHQCLALYHSTPFPRCQGDRMFEFAVGLLLLDVMPNTLLLAATYNFVRSSTLILCGSSAGSIVDRYKRINGMSMCTNNCAFLLCMNMHAPL